MPKPEAKPSPIYFVLSTGRSGTTTLAETISLLPGHRCLHEPEPALILESAWFRYGLVSSEHITNILRSTRSPKLGNSVYCESNQTLSLLIPVIVDSFPNARFIWLLRNGRDFVASAMQKQWYSGHSEHHSDYDHCPPLQRAWIRGRIHGDLAGETSQREWSTFSRFEKCCWYWQYVNSLIRSDLEQHSAGDNFVLRLEQLDQRFGDLVRWMGLESFIVPAAHRHNVAKRTPYHWSRWSEDEKGIFEKRCGQLMDEYYPTWRNDGGYWQDLQYHAAQGVYTSIRRRYRLVRTLNKLLGR